MEIKAYHAYKEILTIFAIDLVLSMGFTSSIACRKVFPINDKVLDMVMIKRCIQSLFFRGKLLMRKNDANWQSERGVVRAYKSLVTMFANQRMSYHWRSSIACIIIIFSAIKTFHFGAIVFLPNTPRWWDRSLKRYGCDYCSNHHDWPAHVFQPIAIVIQVFQAFDRPIL